MGARLPPRLRADRPGAAAARLAPLHRPDRHGHRHGPPRHRRGARPARPGACSSPGSTARTCTTPSSRPAATTTSSPRSPRRSNACPGPAIVYASSRARCESIAQYLNGQRNRSAVVYHAGLTREERTLAQERFMEGEVETVVATNAFGMGIDKADVRSVIHFNLTGTLEAYYQEAGRAGRDGLEAQCVLLYAPGDRFLQELFIENEYPSARSVYQGLRLPARAGRRPDRADARRDQGRGRARPQRAGHRHGPEDPRRGRRDREVLAPREHGDRADQRRGGGGRGEPRGPAPPPGEHPAGRADGAGRAGQPPPGRAGLFPPRRLRPGARPRPPGLEPCPAGARGRAADRLRAAVPRQRPPRARPLAPAARPRHRLRGARGAEAARVRQARSDDPVRAGRPVPPVVHPRTTSATPRRIGPTAAIATTAAPRATSARRGSPRMRARPSTRTPAAR